MSDPDQSDPLLGFRDRFPILGTTTYLISNSLGAMPEAVGASLREYASTWASRGVRAWEESWWELAASTGDLVAPLIGAGPGEVVFHPGVTLAHAVVFSAFDFRGPRPRVVTDAMHFPSVRYLIEGLKADGAEVVDVPTDDGITIDTQRVIDAIDERTALVNLSHVLFKSSYIHDVAAIAERARKVGAVTIIDGYQAVGSIPVDVRSLGVDVYIGGCLKWLCGGPGTAFLWVRPELREGLTPRLTGWMSHARPFAFEPTLDRRSDAWRFLNGTPSIPALYAARPGLEIVREAGIDAIRDKSVHQTGHLLRLADARGFRSTTPRDPDRRAGTVALDVPEGLAVSRALKAREILCDYRPGAGIRLSPHFYTRDDELDLAIDAIAEILDAGAWRAFSGAAGPVT
ncbi:aminotransferase class V-fold PLP-dependent enzyme [Tautonia sp. JC769]|uniref:aminotransferase class V-fold PLP-dependent enzyme n=1 Tax=Tautonia sp. JC769 TaxID=3232135 RepID=UPI00345AB4C1